MRSRAGAAGDICQDTKRRRTRYEEMGGGEQRRAAAVGGRHHEVVGGGLLAVQRRRHAHGARARVHRERRLRALGARARQRVRHLPVCVWKVDDVDELQATPRWFEYIERVRNFRNTYSYIILLNYTYV